MQGEGDDEQQLVPLPDQAAVDDGRKMGQRLLLRLVKRTGGERGRAIVFAAAVRATEERGKKGVGLATPSSASSAS